MMLTPNERINIFGAMVGAHITDMSFQKLKDRGFFVAPASTKHHGAYEGGLIDHSIAVTDALCDLTSDLGLKWQDPRSPHIVGMFHDLCKIDNYRGIVEQIGDGIQIMRFEYNDELVIPGHGEKSIILLSEYLQLTEEEIFCIRWHMGSYDEKENWQYYDRAIRKYPNVLYTHMADMMASKIKGV